MRRWRSRRCRPPNSRRRSCGRSRRSERSPSRRSSPSWWRRSSTNRPRAAVVAVHAVRACRMSPDRSLTMDDYRQLGGMDQAIASRADLLYRAADANGRGAVRRVFEQLVVVDVDSEPTGRRSVARRPRRFGWGGAGRRRRVVGGPSPHPRPRSAYPGADGAGRPRGPAADVASLRQWITEDRTRSPSAITCEKRPLNGSAWIATKPASYRGVRLDAALAALDDSPMPPLETEFLDASRALPPARNSRRRNDRSPGPANRRLRPSSRRSPWRSWCADRRVRRARSARPGASAARRS